MIVGALHPDFILWIEEELDNCPSGTFQQLYGTNDPDLRNLLFLLLKESETGGRYGTLYAESLMAALATRLLYAARLKKLPANTGEFHYHAGCYGVCWNAWKPTQCEFRPCGTSR